MEGSLSPLTSYNYNFISTMLSAAGLILIVLLLPNIVASQSIIKTLPGFAGDLPFKLETGYIGVGDLDDVQLFYYFIESEGSPEVDPLVLWLTGGPGCSAFSGLVYEIGPLSFDYVNSRKYSPTFKLNPYSWTKVANIIFLDAPVGTGFSYANSWEGYNISDTLSVKETYTFLKKWLLTHPKFLKNQLYIAGDSYSGIVVPIIVQEISDGNEAGHNPPMNLQGYVLGNPGTALEIDFNFKVPFAHLRALISNKLYESTRANCKGEYVNVDSNNTLCIIDINIVTECIKKINIAQILEPKCTVSTKWDPSTIAEDSLLSPKPMGTNWDPSAIAEDNVDLLLSLPQISRQWCRSYNYLFSYIWANDKTVQNALHIREGTIKEWVRCNKSLSYTYDISSSLDYHRNLIKYGYRVLIYSGDHDMVIPFLATHSWIKSLNLTILDDWEPWFVDGQIAGYTTSYGYKKYTLTYATVKGAGHTAPEYKPKECLAMVDRWFADYPM